MEVSRPSGPDVLPAPAPLAWVWSHLAGDPDAVWTPVKLYNDTGLLWTGCVPYDTDEAQVFPWTRPEPLSQHWMLRFDPQPGNPEVAELAPASVAPQPKLSEGYVGRLTAAMFDPHRLDVLQAALEFGPELSILGRRPSEVAGPLRVRPEGWGRTQVEQVGWPAWEVPLPAHEILPPWSVSTRALVRFGERPYCSAPEPGEERRAGRGGERESQQSRSELAWQRPAWLPGGAAVNVSLPELQNGDTAVLTTRVAVPSIPFEVLRMDSVHSPPPPRLGVAPDARRDCAWLRLVRDPPPQLLGVEVHMEMGNGFALNAERLAAQPPTQPRHAPHPFAPDREVEALAEYSVPHDWTPPPDTTPEHQFSLKPRAVGHLDGWRLRVRRAGPAGLAPKQALFVRAGARVLGRATEVATDSGAQLAGNAAEAPLEGMVPLRHAGLAPEPGERVLLLIQLISPGGQVNAELLMPFVRMGRPVFTALHLLANPAQNDPLPAQSWDAGPAGRQWAVEPLPPGPCGVHSGAEDTVLQPEWCGALPGRRTVVVAVDDFNDAAVGFRPEMSGCWPLPANLELQATISPLDGAWPIPLEWHVDFAVGGEARLLANEEAVHADAAAEPRWAAPAQPPMLAVVAPADGREGRITFQIVESRDGTQLAYGQPLVVYIRRKMSPRLLGLMVVCPVEGSGRAVEFPPPPGGAPRNESPFRVEAPYGAGSQLTVRLNVDPASLQLQFYSPTNLAAPEGNAAPDGWAIAAVPMRGAVAVRPSPEMPGAFETTLETEFDFAVVRFLLLSPRRDGSGQREVAPKPAVLYITRGPRIEAVRVAGPHRFATPACVLLPFEVVAAQLVPEIRWRNSSDFGFNFVDGQMRLRLEFRPHEQIFRDITLGTFLTIAQPGALLGSGLLLRVTTPLDCPLPRGCVDVVVFLEELNEDEGEWEQRGPSFPLQLRPEMPAPERMEVLPGDGLLTAAYSHDGGPFTLRVHLAEVMNADAGWLLELHVTWPAEGDAAKQTDILSPQPSPAGSAPVAWRDFMASRPAGHPRPPASQRGLAELRAVLKHRPGAREAGGLDDVLAELTGDLLLRRQPSLLRDGATVHEGAGLCMVSSDGVCVLPEAQGPQQSLALQLPLAFDGALELPAGWRLSCSVRVGPGNAMGSSQQVDAELLPPAAAGDSDRRIVSVANIQPLNAGSKAEVSVEIVDADGAVQEAAIVAIRRESGVSDIDERLGSSFHNPHHVDEPLLRFSPTSKLPMPR